MIDSIKVKNLSTEAEIQFTKTAGSNFLLETDGIDWGSASAKHNTYTNLTGIGDIITSTKIQDRTISITGRICSKYSSKEVARRYGTSSVVAIAEYKLEEIEDCKRKLSQLVNPVHHLRVITGKYYIDGKPTSSVKFSSSWSENNDIYCKFMFSIECENPMFHYLEEDSIALSGTSSGFHFPLTLKKPRGVRFGIRTHYQLVLVKNLSDCTIGGTFTLKANGAVNSSIITNVYSQEKIKLDKALVRGEIVKIDTVNRTVKGSLDGGVTYTDYYKYWDFFENTWIQFDIGNSLIGYSTGDETYKNLEVSIQTNNSFYSMEAQ